MSHDPRNTDDKFELHYRQQLSALVDGELAPDEARFLLRRLQHDGELSGRFERWQLCGDVLRGQVRRPAAPDLATRVAASLAAPPAAADAAAGPAGRRRLAWNRWGGGAALAASVAAVAIFVGRPDPAATGHVPDAVAAHTLPSTEAVLAVAEAAKDAGDAGLAPAPAPLRAQARPAPRQVAAVQPPQREPLAIPRLQMADAAVEAAAAAGPLDLGAAVDPFASAAPLEARPWPRAALGAGGSRYTASFGQAEAGSTSFYPFEPSLAEPATMQEDVPGLPEPPPPGLQR